jgi:hypothetical protein
MKRIDLPTRRSSCACGRVRCEARGRPIVSLVCYCDDCHEGARAIEALPDSAPLRLADGGTPLLTYRDDRFRCSSGADQLVGYKLRDSAPTRRMVASCCNSAMFLKYAPGFFMSIQIEHRRADTELPRDTPCYRGFPMQLFAKVISARVAMLLGR